LINPIPDGLPRSLREFLESPGGRPSAAVSEKRQRSALKVLTNCRAQFEEFKASGDKDGMRETCSRAMFAWQVFAHEMAWLLDASSLWHWDSEERYPLVWTEQGAVERQQLLHSLMLFQHILAYEEDLDPVALLLPRSLFLELRDAIEALTKGETLSLLRPRASRRHGPAWSWDKMRLRALEHVHFLVGQGVAIGDARDQVSAAMKNVSAQTLRDWQERECPRLIPQLGERLQQAHIAGEVFARVCVDNTYGEREGEIGYESWVIQGLVLDEDLESFGKRYAAQFGSRHWSRPQSEEN
jgi:hypothetical protein